MKRKRQLRDLMNQLDQEENEVKPTVFDNEEEEEDHDNSLLSSAFNFQSPTISRRQKTTDNSFLNVSVLVSNMNYKYYIVLLLLLLLILIESQF